MPEERRYGCARRELRAWLSHAGQIVVLGVGSSLRRDDFVGVKIARGLRDRVPDRVHLFECETVPESFIEPIVELKPTHILITDAALLNLPPGSSMLVEPSKIQGSSISTHALPLSILCEFLSKETGAKISILAVQPKETGFGEGLTEELEESLKDIVNLLVDVLSEI